MGHVFGSTMLGTMLVGLIVPRDPFFTFPDYVTPEEASALVAAAPSYEVRIAMRIRLRTGLRVSECLSRRLADLRLNQDPPILSLRPDIPGNKSKRGREASVPAGLVELLADLKSFHRRNL